MKRFKIGMLLLALTVVVASSAFKNNKSAMSPGEYFYVTVATTNVTTTTQLDNGTGALDETCVDITECDLTSSNACIVKQLVSGYRTIAIGGPKS